LFNDLPDPSGRPLDNLNYLVGSLLSASSRWRTAFFPDQEPHLDCSFRDALERAKRIHDKILNALIDVPRKTFTAHVGATPLRLSV